MKRKDPIDKIILNALTEDEYRRDITSRTLVGKLEKTKGHIIAKDEGVLSGINIAKKIFKKVDRKIIVTNRLKDGQSFRENTVIATFHGPTRSLLTAERTVLNFLGYLSGIATNTSKYVKQAKGTRAKIYDTRKTTPGLRILDKYAVRCGGGANHRLNLNDMVLIKDNHILSFHNRKNLYESILHCRRKTNKKITIEVDTLDQFEDVLVGEPDIILLDNMNTQQLKKAVALTKKLPLQKRPFLEASGGINLVNIRSVALTGIERISVGALTHTFKSINFSMEFTQ